MKMTPRRRRTLLWAAVALLGMATVVAAVAPLTAPLAEGESPKNPAVGDRSARSAQSGLQGHTLPLEDYTVICKRPLRRPLYDPKPQPEPEPEKPKLNLTLLGTAVEPGFTYAMFQTSGREQKLVTVGQTIEGAELQAVRNGEADLLFHGETVTLKMEKDN